MSTTVISILAILAFGSTKSFLGGIVAFIFLIAAFMSLTTDFGVIAIQ